MAGPISGYGGQQVPISNTFQPGKNNEQVRQQQDQQAQSTNVQPQGTQAAQSQSVETNNQDVLKAQQNQSVSASSERSSDSPPTRGSLVDITV